MSVGPQLVTYGNVSATYVLQVALTPAAVAATTSAEQTFTVPGLQTGDQISAINFQGAWTVLVDIVNYRVIGNNSLGISFQNNTGGSLSPPSGNYLLEVNRPGVSPLVGIIQ
jgi:hypothetical protein